MWVDKAEEAFVISLLEGAWWGEYDKDKEENIWNNRVIRKVAVMQRSWMQAAVKPQERRRRRPADMTTYCAPSSPRCVVVFVEHTH